MSVRAWLAYSLDEKGKTAARILWEGDPDPPRLVEKIELTEHDWMTARPKAGEVMLDGLCRVRPCRGGKAKGGVA